MGLFGCLLSHRLYSLIKKFGLLGFRLEAVDLYLHFFFLPFFFFFGVFLKSIGGKCYPGEYFWTISKGDFPWNFGEIGTGIGIGTGTGIRIEIGTGTGTGIGLGLDNSLGKKKKCKFLVFSRFWGLDRPPSIRV
jgi:hypothetical protein